jgi:hypothetical protein
VTTPATVPAPGKVVCETCEQQHVATYSHEGRFGEGPIFEVVCPVDGLSDFYTSLALL